MLIDEAPAQISKDPIEPNTQQWKVAIIDSTKSPHGPDDTRASSNSTGVGRGVIRIFTDPNGAVAGYCWSEGSKSKFEPETERNLVIGRLSPLHE